MAATHTVTAIFIGTIILQNHLCRFFAVGFNKQPF